MDSRQAASRHVLSLQKEFVRVFYQEMWNKADISLVAGLMREDVTFRGSLGPELVGPAAVAGYVRSVTTALGGYTCDIKHMTEEDDRIAVRLLFHGLHRGVFMGFAPTGQRVSWAGSAHFTFRDDGAPHRRCLGARRSARPHPAVAAPCRRHRRNSPD